MASLASSSSSAGLTRAPTMLEQLLEEINFQRTKELRQMLKDGSYARSERCGRRCLSRFKGVKTFLRVHARVVEMGGGVRMCAGRFGVCSERTNYVEVSLSMKLTDRRNILGPSRLSLRGYVLRKLNCFCFPFFFYFIKLIC